MNSDIEENQTSTIKRKKEELEKKKNLVEPDEPKPRIVLTFRPEKPGMKSSNMKIVSTEEKHDEISPKRLTRARVNDLETFDEEGDNSVIALKGKTVQSESDDQTSDSTSTLKRSTRRRSKEYSDNVLANAIARKEKSYEPPATTTRLSRRIKPTAKILANKELRIGLERCSKVRLGIIDSEINDDSGIQTRRSARKKSIERKTSKIEAHGAMQTQSEDVEIGRDNKKKHLNNLGLKEVNDECSMDNSNTDDLSIKHGTNR